MRKLMVIKDFVVDVLANVLSAEVSYYRMSLKITNENFTDDLRNMSSEKSIRLRVQLERSVSQLFTAGSRIIIQG